MWQQSTNTPLWRCIGWKHKLLKCQPEKTQDFPLISGQPRSVHKSKSPSELCRRFSEVSSGEVNKLHCSISSKTNEYNMSLVDIYAVLMLFSCVCEGIFIMDPPLHIKVTQIQ